MTTSVRASNPQAVFSGRIIQRVACMLSIPRSSANGEEVTLSVNDFPGTIQTLSYKD